MSSDGFSATGCVPEVRNTNVSRQRERIHEGTPNAKEVETGGHRVQGDGRNYVGSTWSPFGVDGADEERCKKEGAAPPLKWAEKLRIADDRMRRRLAEERKKRDGMDEKTAAAQAREITAEDQLAAALKAVEGDKELELRVFESYLAKKKRAAEPAPAAPVAPAAEKPAKKAHAAA